MIYLTALAEELRRKDDPANQEEHDLIRFILTILLERRTFSTIVCLTAIHEGLCLDSDWEQAETVAEIIEEVDTPRDR